MSVNDKELENRLQDYHAAIRSEFEAKAAVADGTRELEEQIREFYKNNSVGCAAQIVWLANNASSEGVRFQACKFVIAEGLDAEMRNRESPIEVLMKELHTGSDSKKQKAQLPA